MCFCGSLGLYEVCSQSDGHQLGVILWGGMKLEDNQIMCLGVVFVGLCQVCNKFRQQAVDQCWCPQHCSLTVYVYKCMHTGLAESLPCSPTSRHACMSVTAVLR